MMTTGHRSRNLLIGIAAAVVALIAVAIVLALQPAEQLDPTTPEGAVQGYFQAIVDDDPELARAYFAPEVVDRCQRFDFHPPENTSVVIVDTETRDDDVRVRVEITESYGSDPFGGGSYTFDESLTLIQSGDRWLISEPTWPMDFCAEVS